MPICRKRPIRSQQLVQALGFLGLFAPSREIDDISKLESHLKRLIRLRPLPHGLRIGAVLALIWHFLVQTLSLWILLTADRLRALERFVEQNDAGSSTVISLSTRSLKPR
ncbi:MAG: hypothetical protein C1943_13400 [Halochromatium sp.]|nr:hypothetical protein [Halochromatium sp.]